MKPAQFSLSGSSAVIRAPYAQMIKPGMKLYLPAVSGYANGLPLEVLTVIHTESTATLTFSVLDFTQTLETYQVDSAQLTPDWSGIVML